MIQHNSVDPQALDGVPLAPYDASVNVRAAGRVGVCWSFSQLIRIVSDLTLEQRLRHRVEAFCCRAPNVPRCTSTTTERAPRCLGGQCRGHQ